MTIRAKFAGTCRICAERINVGAEIEWEKGKGAMHIECKDKTPVVSADTDLSALAKQHGYELLGEARIRHYTERVTKGERLKAIGSTFEAREGKMLVVAHTKPQYYSEDYLEDMDWFDMRPGLYYEVSAIAIHRSVDEQAKLDADKAAKQAKQDAEATAEKRQSAHFAELTTPPEGWTAIDGALRDAAVEIVSKSDSEKFTERPLPIPPKSEWTKLDEEHQQEGMRSYAVLYQAGPYRVLEHGDFDDWRVMVMIPPALVDGYISAICADRKITKTAAEKWLARYRGCVGTQIYEWAVAHLA